jgi:DNA processing protein
METDGHTLSLAERRDRLRLYRSENVGTTTFFRLLQQFGTASRAIEALPALARRGGRRDTLRICTRAEADRELECLDRLGGRLLCFGEPDFPPPLAVLETAPLLTLVGRSELLRRDAVAMVGTRNASGGARRMAAILAAGFGQAGLVVVSGLARGIDAAAHEAALATGTIAVLAGGVDVPFPPENHVLYQRIRAEGCVISEMPPGTSPKANHFPRRNRLVSGLALGVVVVEAALRSGSLITARLALEQGRELFAVPGSPLDPRCQGANDLIKRGAQLTETVEDVLAVLAPMRPIAPPSPPARPVLPLFEEGPDTDETARMVLRTLSAVPVTVDEMLRQCQLSPAALATVLVELELAGRLERLPGNRVALLP